MGLQERVGSEAVVAPAATRLATFARGSGRRPKDAAELAAWPTRLFSTSESPLCALVVPGRPGYPQVVLLHGWAMNRSAWAEAAMPLIEAGCGVLMPDLPGHGDSPDLPGELGDRPREHFARMASQLGEVTDALGWQRFAVAGYSMGATLALALVRAHRDRIDRLLLLDPIVTVPALQMLATPSAQLGFYAKMARAFSTPESRMPAVVAALTVCGLPLPTALRRPLIGYLMTRSGFGEQSAFASYVGTGGATDVEAFERGLNRTDRRAIMRCFEAKHRVDHRAEVVGFGGPLNIVLGEHDLFCPAGWADRLASKARAAGTPVRIGIIDDADHLAICQQPAAVGAALMVWLDR